MSIVPLKQLYGTTTALTLTVSLLLFTGLTTCAYAELRRAFVVGIDRYDHFDKDLQLDNAVSDASAVGQKLTDLGFDEVSLQLDPVRYEFHVAWQEFLDSINAGDTVAFFYSGHGVAIDGQNYLLPRSMPDLEPGRSELVKSESLSLNNLLTDIQKRNPAVTLMILDACRNDPFSSSNERGVGASGGLAGSNDPPSGTFIMYSAEAGKVALDSMPGESHSHSVYTRHLLDLMSRGDLDIASMARELRKRVNQTTKDYADGFAQSPAYYDGLIGDFCLPGCASDIELNQAIASGNSPTGTDSVEDKLENAYGETRAATEVATDIQVAAVQPSADQALPEVSKKDRRAASTLRKKGEKLYWRDRDEALAVYQRATTRDPTNEEGWKQLGGLYERSDDYSEAMRAYERVLMLAEARDDGQWKSIALVSIGRIHHQQNNIEKAENYYDQALAFEQDQQRIADLHKRLGSIHMARSDTSDAEKQFLKAVAIYKELKLESDVAAMYSHLGGVRMEYGDFEKAESQHLEALKIYEKLKDKSGMGWQYNSLALVYRERGDTDTAEQYHKKAITVYEQIDERPGLARQLRFLGELYALRDELEQAETVFFRALGIYESMGNTDGLATQYSRLGQIYQKREDLDQSEHYQRKALAAYEAVGSKGGMAEAYGDLGMIYRERGELDKTEEYWRKGHALYEELGNQRQMNKFTAWLNDYL